MDAELQRLTRRRDLARRLFYVTIGVFVLFVVALDLYDDAIGRRINSLMIDRVKALEAKVDAAHPKPEARDRARLVDLHIRFQGEREQILAEEREFMRGLNEAKSDDAALAEAEG